MGYDATGIVYIPLEEFWDFVRKYMPDSKVDFSAFGPPRLTEVDLEISYAMSTECDPADWAEPPEAVTQWKKEKK